MSATRALFVLSTITVVASLPVRSDVPIDTRSGAVKVILDFHRGTGNYFAAVLWPPSWTDIALYLSTDGGATWLNTSVVNAVDPDPSDMDMVVAGDYVYIAYSQAGAAKLERFVAATGFPDGTYPTHTLLDLSPTQVTDVALASNQDGADDEIYCAFISNDGVLRYFFDDSADGRTFTTMAPGVANALTGLDMTFNPGPVDHTVFLSYWDTTGNVHVWRGFPWGDVWSGNYSGYLPSTMWTAVSASNDLAAACNGVHTTDADSIHVVWSQQGFDYNASSGMNGNSPGTHYHAGDITARGDRGLAAVYLQEAGDFDPVLLRRHRGNLDDWWFRQAQVQVNEHDAATARRANITWLPPNHYGIAYIGLGAAGPTTPYFVRFEIPLFDDGFNQGNTSYWSAVVPDDPVP